MCLPSCSGSSEFSREYSKHLSLTSSVFHLPRFSTFFEMLGMHCALAGKNWTHICTHNNEEMPCLFETSIEMEDIDEISTELDHELNMISLTNKITIEKLPSILMTLAFNKNQNILTTEPVEKSKRLASRSTRYHPLGALLDGSTLPPSRINRCTATNSSSPSSLSPPPPLTPNSPKHINLSSSSSSTNNSPLVIATMNNNNITHVINNQKNIPKLSDGEITLKLLSIFQRHTKSYFGNKKSVPTEKSKLITLYRAFYQNPSINTWIQEKQMDWDDNKSFTVVLFMKAMCSCFLKEGWEAKILHMEIKQHMKSNK